MWENPYVFRFSSSMASLSKSSTFQPLKYWLASVESGAARTTTPVDSDWVLTMSCALCTIADTSGRVPALEISLLFILMLCINVSINSFMIKNSESRLSLHKSQSLHYKVLKPGPHSNQNSKRILHQ